MHRIVKRTFSVGVGLVVLCGLNGCASKATNWKFTDAQGEMRDLSDYEGQVVVISFSNTWCEPCREAAIHMQALQQRFGPHGVKVITVSSWERGDPQQWMLERGYTYGVMINGTHIARKYDIDQVPTFLVIGVDGRVIYRHDGLSKSTPDKLARVIDKHLRQHGAKAYAKHKG